jgi:urea transport system ATP-binding protein
MSPQERQATGELLQRLAEEHTVVVIEHDMAFLRQFARKVTVLHQGRLLVEGAVDEVQSDPRVQEVYLGRSQRGEGDHEGSENDDGTVGSSRNEVEV